MLATLLYLSLLNINAHMIRVGVVDTGLDIHDERFTSVLCPSGHKDFTGEGIEDTIGHGTHVTGLIKQYAGDSKEYCLVIIKSFSKMAPAYVQLDQEVAAFRYAATLRLDYINYSAGGPGYNEAEFYAIADHPYTTFIVAAGNDGKDLGEAGNRYYPASYNLPNIVAVGSEGSLTSNYGGPVSAFEHGDNVLSTLPKDQYGYMSGTSMAAAIHTGKLVKMQLTVRGNE